ncbi:hypothetical protein AAHA92_29286 [Salvia divinorum]|uniref:Secreted protein n=1 Tax=Salvia divinorum TaxID=28513 RepID=A0ABD1FXX3_SALDI
MWALAVAAHLSLTRSLSFPFKSAVASFFFQCDGSLLVPSSHPCSLAVATSPSVTWETSHHRERHSAGSVKPQLGSLDFEVLKIYGLYYMLL